MCISSELLPLFLFYLAAARRDVARLNKIEIKEVVHCLYIYAARQLAVRRGFFHCFPQVFIDIWISHMLNMVVYH